MLIILHFWAFCQDLTFLSKFLPKFENFSKLVTYSRSVRFCHKFAYFKLSTQKMTISPQRFFKKAQGLIFALNCGKDYTFRNWAVKMWFAVIVKVLILVIFKNFSVVCLVLGKNGGKLSKKDCRRMGRSQIYPIT